MQLLSPNAGQIHHTRVRGAQGRFSLPDCEQGQQPPGSAAVLRHASRGAIPVHPSPPGKTDKLRTPNAKGGVVPFPPHVMFYAPYLTNADLGLDSALGPDGNPVGPVFVAGEGSPHALIIVPVGEHQNAGHFTAQ